MYAKVFIIVGIVSAFAESCTLIQPTTDPDWANMNKDWQDVLNMPTTAGGSVDCYHWMNMTGDENGFYVDLGVNVAGYPSHSYKDYFVKKRTGVYEMSGDYIDKFVETVKAANAYKLDEDLEDAIDGDAQWMAARDIALITDNHNYLIFTMCTNWGPITWVKFPSTSPTISQLVDSWNALVRNGLMGPAHHNEACAK